MITGVLRKLLKGVRQPSKIPPYVRMKYLMASNRNAKRGVFEAEGVADYQALMVTNVYKTYLRDVDYDKRTNEWMNMRGLPRALNRLGFNVDIYDGSDNPRRSLWGGTLSATPDDLSRYDLLIGSGRNFFEYAKELDPEVPVIFRAGSEHWTSRAPAYHSRIDRIQRRKQIEYRDTRGGISKVGTTAIASDAILGLADDRTRRVWEQNFPNTVVRNVPISHPPSEEFDVSTREYDTARKTFVCYAGNGPVLKGIDIALEAFDGLDDLDLYLVGPQNKEAYGQFAEIYDEELNDADNIHNVGWVEMFSDTYYEVCEKSGYLIYPSATEGGSPPGAVVSMIWHGVVPIVSEAAYANPGEYGIQLSDTRIETVRDAVREASRRHPDDLRAFSERVYEHAREKHARPNVSEEIENTINEMLTELGFYETRQRPQIESR